MDEKYRLPFVALVALAVVGVVVVAVVGLGSLGSSAKSAGPTSPSASVASALTATPAATPTDPLSTPEGATRAFFNAFSEARRTDDPTLVEPYVTSKDSGAYLSVAGFLGGELAVNRASIVTVQRFDNMTSSVTSDTATVDFDYTEGGYNIDPSTGTATETQSVLAPVHITATLRRVDGRWLMDSYVSKS